MQQLKADASSSTSQSLTGKGDNVVDEAISPSTLGEKLASVYWLLSFVFLGVTCICCQFVVWSVVGVMKAVVAVNRKALPVTRSDLQAMFEFWPAYLYSMAAYLLLSSAWFWNWTPVQLPTVDGIMVQSRAKNPTAKSYDVRNEIIAASLSSPVQKIRSLFGLAPSRKVQAGRFVIMCNHLSNADGVLVKGLLFPIPTRTMYKASLNKVPILGVLFMTARDIPIHFKDQKSFGIKEGKREVIYRRMLESLDSNVPVLCFPEGVRSRVGRMCPFRRGIFDFCIKNDVPILPMVVYRTQERWPIETSSIRYGDFECHVSSTFFSPQGHDSFSIMDVVRDEMVSLLKKCQGYDPMIEFPIKDVDQYNQVVANLDNQKTE